VRDKGKQWGALSVRGPDTNGGLNFHTDYADIVGLLCLGRAKTGGLSRIASSVTLHNELLRQHSEHLPLLYRGFRYIKREATESAEPVTGYLPVFGERDGVLSCRFIRERIEAAAKRVDQPLSEAERAALDCIAAVVGDPRVHIDMDLELGDIQLINNYTVLHARTAFEDGDGPNERRHLLRLWLTFDGPRRPMAESFPPANGYAVPGAPPPEGAVALGLTSG
jgi:alpha-ketoglutarate-dependent taurine dioxygenase